MISYENYLSSLQNHMSSQFDIVRDYNINSTAYDLYGKLNVSNSKYLLSEKVQIYQYNNNEHLLVKSLTDLSLQTVQEEVLFLKKELPRLITPGKNHMSSLITLLLPVEGEIPRETEKFVRRFRYQKGHALGFRGWTDIIVAVVSLSENRVLTHRNFLKSASFFHPQKVCPKERT